MKTMNGLHEIQFCEVCENHDLESVLNLGAHPMCDDLVRIGDDRRCREYPIEILFCKNCFTAHQRFQIPKKELFPNTYHYRSRFTVDVLNGMADLVEAYIQRFGSLVGKRVLDIGCNDGSLLDFFRQKGAITFGIEPTDASFDAQKKGHITFNGFFSVDVVGKIIALHGKPDVITFTNVFAHIENLHEVIDSLRRLMDTHTLIVIENHYLGSVLDGIQFDTFYHEHPRNYSYMSFEHIAKLLGVCLLWVEFPSRYGGNIRVFLGKNSNNSSDFVNSKIIMNIREKENHFFEKFLLLQKNVEHWCEVKKSFLDMQFLKYGKLSAKAFPGRAAILIKLLGLNENHISEVYEKHGSIKVGYYLPGTRIPIDSDNKLFALNDKTLPILNLAWHISSEIKNYLTHNGYSGQVIDILNSDDFVAGK